MEPARPIRQYTPPLPILSASSGGPEGRWRRLLVRAAGALGLFVLLGLLVGLGTYAYFDRGLPSVEALRNYHPPQVTKVTCEDGSVCAEYFRERRTLVDTRELPAHVRNAFLAAEDADFYQHREGLDFLGMLRAALKAVIPGGHITGASTITQQACRNLLLSQERKLSRKIREWILTPRMEKALTKDQILDLYLNQIYFGQGRYGVEEAALYYFGKHAKDLSVGEAATLAGTVQSPERINPVTNIVRAKRRQVYVLNQLVKHGFLPAGAVQLELDKPIVLAPRPPPLVGPYYIEEIRKMLLARYGEQALLDGGLRVQIAMRLKLQAIADEALRNGLENLDRQMGYRGPLGTLGAQRFAALRSVLEKRLAQAGRRPQDEPLVADLTRLASTGPAPQPDPGQEQDQEGVEEDAAAHGGEPDEAPAAEAPASEEELAARRIPLVPLTADLRLGGYVTQVDDAHGTATVDLVGRQARIAFSTLGWARPWGVGKWTPAPTRMSDVMKPGDLIRVRITQLTPSPQPLEATLDQIPQVQGAVTVIDPATRHVVALSGGYDFELSPFNRATQAKRQPGSSFKPFVYAAALASQKFTPLTVLDDAPDAVRDPYTGKTWKPHNYEQAAFEGPMTLREALTKSKNTVSVRLIEAITPQAAIDFARKAGIHSDLPNNLTLALGTGEVTQLEIANAYATFDDLGQYADPVLLMRVTDAKGTVLEEHTAAFQETVNPAVAYLTTSLMRSVVEDSGGTGAQARELNRPVAGKTGTASEYRDAWFTGYTPDLVTSAWVGFDDHSSLGSSQTGGHAALPIWLDFMKQAEADQPVRDFDVPRGITQVRIDPQTGLLAGSSVPGRLEPFLDGTAPKTEAPPPGQLNANQYYLQTEGRSGL